MWHWLARISAMFALGIFGLLFITAALAILIGGAVFYFWLSG